MADQYNAAVSAPPPTFNPMTNAGRAVGPMACAAGRATEMFVGET